MADLVRKAERVVTDAGATSATRVEVTVGCLSHLSPDHLKSHFDRVAGGTLLDGAELCVVESGDATAPDALEIRLTSVSVVGAR